MCGRDWSSDVCSSDLSRGALTSAPSLHNFASASNLINPSLWNCPLLRPSDAECRYFIGTRNSGTDLRNFSSIYKSTVWPSITLCFRMIAFVIYCRHYYWCRTINKHLSLWQIAPGPAMEHRVARGLLLLSNFVSPLHDSPLCHQNWLKWKASAAAKILFACSTIYGSSATGFSVRPWLNTDNITITTHDHRRLSLLGL